MTLVPLFSKVGSRHTQAVPADIHLPWSQRLWDKIPRPPFISRICDSGSCNSTCPPNR